MNSLFSSDFDLFDHVKIRKWPKTSKVRENVTLVFCSRRSDETNPTRFNLEIRKK